MPSEASAEGSCMIHKVRDVGGNMGKAACGECIIEGVQREHVKGVFQGVCTEGSVWRE